MLSLDVFKCQPSLLLLGIPVCRFTFRANRRTLLLACPFVSASKALENFYSSQLKIPNPPKYRVRYFYTT